MNHPAAKPATLPTVMPLGVAGWAGVCGGTNLNDARPGETPASTQGTAE